jgi:hypothetical protein
MTMTHHVTAPPSAQSGFRPTARQIAARRRFVADLIPADTGSAEIHLRAADHDSLRAAAHAAFHEVVRGNDAALDSALDVYAARIARLETRIAQQTEALKLIRGYASEAWLRAAADHALHGRPTDLPVHMPVTLFDPELARSGADEEAR